MKERSGPSSKSFSRRDFLKLSSAAGGAMLLAACAPAATQAPAQSEPTKAPEQPTQAPEATKAPEQPTSAPAAAGAVEISWWNQFTTDTCKEWFPKIVAKFEEKNPNIKVKFEISGGPPGGGDYIEVLMARIAAGNPPEAITLWSPPSQFGARGALAAIDEMMASADVAKPDAYYTGVLQSCQFKGKTYGLPASAGAGCVFINTKMFKDKGISTKREDFPKTWDEIWALAEKFNVWKGDELDIAGLVPWTQGWLKPVWSELNGGKIFDSKSLTYSIDSENNIELLEWWQKWLKEQFKGDIEKFNTWGKWGDVYPETAFSMGKTAIDLSGNWACTDAGIPFEWEVMKLPTGPKGSKQVTGFWPNWFAMPKGLPHPAEGFKFIEFMTTEGWGIWYSEAIMDTPAWKGYPADKPNKKLIETVGNDRALDIQAFFNAYLNDTAEMWTSPVEDFASDTMNASIDEVLHNTKSAKDALSEAQATVTAKLQETLKS
jgi:multiple sugar transport system substrate-binding protein